MRLDLLSEAELPVTVGRYTLTGLLGEGGMARVFRAEMMGDLGFRKAAAVKVVLPARGDRSEELRKQLVHEARVGGLLNHPNVVQTFDCGQMAGFPYIAMELVDGIGLGELIEAAGPLPVAVALDIAIQCCRGLQHAHTARHEGKVLGIIHRDVKPSNILVRGDGVVKLVDFGIAKAQMGDMTTTASGMTKGTPSYMSPEQLNAEGLDLRSDLFAMGAVLYQMLTARILFGGSSLTEVMMRIIQVDETVRKMGTFDVVERIAPGLGPLFGRLLTANRDARFGSALELEDALQDVLAIAPPSPSLAWHVAKHFAHRVHSGEETTGPQVRGTEPRSRSPRRGAGTGGLPGSSAASLGSAGGLLPGALLASGARTDPRVAAAASGAASRPGAAEIPETVALPSSSAMAGPAAMAAAAEPVVTRSFRGVPGPAQAPAPPSGGWPVEDVPAVPDAGGDDFGDGAAEDDDEEGVPLSTQSRPSMRAAPKVPATGVLSQSTRSGERSRRRAEREPEPDEDLSGDAVPGTRAFPPPGKMRAMRQEIRQQRRILLFMGSALGALLVLVAFFGWRVAFGPKRGDGLDAGTVATDATATEAPAAASSPGPAEPASAPPQAPRERPSRPAKEREKTKETAAAAPSDGDARMREEQEARDREAELGEERAAAEARERDRAELEELRGRERQRQLDEERARAREREAAESPPPPPPPAPQIETAPRRLAIQHSPVARAVVGVAMPISVQVEGPADTVVVVHYGPKGGGPYTKLTLKARGNGRWEGSVPVDAASAGGLEYWIVATHDDADPRLVMSGSRFTPHGVAVY
jgi:hypothetical protein